MVITPTELALGSGEPCGKTKTSHVVADPTSVHAKVAAVCVCPETTTAVGLGQVGAGVQVILANQPARLLAPSLLNRKVKQPVGLDEVNGPGIVVPQ